MPKNETVGAVDIEIMANESKFNKQTPKLAQGFSKDFTKGLKTAGFATGIAFIVKEAVEGVSKSIQKAIDVVEIEDFFSRAFGNMQDDVRAWSNELQDSLGLNAVSLRQNATTLFRMSGAMGTTRKQALTMSKDLTQVAADLSSALNVPMQEAFDKIRAGLSGESEPLKRWGFVVNETTTKAKAYEMGIAEVGKELTEAQKVMARYAKIMELTAVEQGNLAATIDSPANQLRILDTQFDIIQQNIGKAFLPLLQEIIPVLVNISKAIADVSARVSEFIRSLKGVQNETADSADNNTKAQLKQAKALQKTGKAAKAGIQGFDELNKIQKKQAKDANKATADIIAQEEAKKSDETVKANENIQNTLEDTKDKALEVVNPIVQVGIAIKNAFMGIVKVLDGIIDIVASIIAAVIGLVTGNTQTVLNAFNGIAEGIKKIFFGLWETIKSIFKGIIWSIASIVVGTAAVVKNAFVVVWDLVKSSVLTFGEDLKDMFMLIGNTISDIFKGIWITLKTIIIGIGNGIKMAATGIKNAVAGIFGSLADIVGAIFTGILTTTILSWNGITNTIKTAVNVIIDAINTVTSAWNKLQFKVPKIKIGDAEFGGVSIGVPKIGKIARLDTGASPSISGPQDNTVNLLDGLSSAITSGFLQASQFSQQNQGASLPEIIMNIDAKEVGRAILPSLNAEQNRIGNRTVIRTVGGAR